MSELVYRVIFNEGFIVGYWAFKDLFCRKWTLSIQCLTYSRIIFLNPLFFKEFT